MTLRELQIKTTLRFHLTTGKWPTYRKLVTPAGMDVGTKVPYSLLVKLQTCAAIVEVSMKNVQKTEN